MSGMFDDLTPQSNLPSSGGMFDDLVPEEKTGRSGGLSQYFEGSIPTELVEGVASGLIGIGEGVIGAGALGIDLVTGGNSSDDVTATAEGIRDYLGLDP